MRRPPLPSHPSRTGDAKEKSRAMIASTLGFHSMLAVIGMALIAGAEEPLFKPEDLRCDGRTSPLGVDCAQPALSWTAASERRGFMQSAFQILAASAPELLQEAQADLWDSGKTLSNAQRAHYGGTPLPSMARVFWSLRIWDETDQASSWSPPATWTMGIMRPEDWQARWITGANDESLPSTARWIWIGDEDGLAAAPGKALFKRTFHVREDAPLRTARLHAAMDNCGLLVVNNAPAEQLRGWENVLAIDLLERLVPGTNQILVAVENESDAPNPAGLLACLQLEYEGGDVSLIPTNGEWQATREEDPAAENTWSRAAELGPNGMAPWGVVTPRNQALPLFRKTFTVENKPIQRAIANICGLGHFELTINGRGASDQVFDPGWTNYKKTCLYASFDVTALLHPGENALGVMLGNGLYNVVGGRYVKFTGSFGPPKLIFQMHLFHEDGTEMIVSSDNSWKTEDGPIVFSCPYGGEDYDARRERPGWDGPGFHDAAWRNARATEGPGGALRAQTHPPIRVVERLDAASVKRLAPGAFEADMGANLSARPSIKVVGKAGDQVILRLGERPGEPWDGHWYAYTLRGGAEETFTPRFTYFGFQYITVEGADLPEDASGERPLLLDLKSEFVTSSAEKSGAFHCSNPLLNEIDAMVERSVRSNLQSVLTDCPHREKLGWLEVAHLMGPSILYHNRAHGLYRKICRDAAEAQLDNGMIPCIAPEYTRFSGGFFESAEWASASVQLPWLLYRWYGDADTLSREYETMARYTDYLAGTRNDQGLAKAGLGDWYDWTPERGHAGYSQLTPGELTASAMLFDNARIMARTAALLGKADDAARFQALANEVRRDFIAAYCGAEAKGVASGSQAALAAALYFGLIPDNAHNDVFNALTAQLEQDAYKPSTGEVCFRYLLLALAEAGRSDLVYRIVNRTDCPGYGWMLREFGLQTLSEQWDKPGSSLNHCMFGHVREWFQRYAIGIGQTEDSNGFEQLLLTPTPVGDLTEASGFFDGPRGRIALSWRKTPDQFILDATIPGNTSAIVVLPVDPKASLTESGLPLAEAPGILSVEARGKNPAAIVGSGTYRFVCLDPGW